MANKEHLAILRQGVDVWNKWRGANGDVRPDLVGANLRDANLPEVYLRGAHLGRANLHGAQLIEADLFGAHLSRVDLYGANLSEANLSEARLRGAYLYGANLTGVNLTGAHLFMTDLTGANLTGADLTGVNLTGAHLTGAHLTGANLTKATISMTVFGDNDLGDVHGLDTVKHAGPSTVGIDTLVKSKGIIPDVFLRGCGVPQSFIEYLPSLIGAMQPIQFYSCFISYSSKNEDFAQRLYERMQSHHLRVWFAPEDMKPGAKLHEQIDQAIRIHDKLVLVLSEQSIQSEWVMTEIRKARKAELRDNRRKLFPIRLVDMDTLRDWECFDADTGKDLAVEVREYFVPDFTRWKDHDAFERAFAKLLDGLKAVDAAPVPRVEPLKTSVQSKTKPQNQQTVIARKKRRLEVLEEQQAIKGISTPPEVVTEIEDLRREIAELQDTN